jgi:hypothetical protein
MRKTQFVLMPACLGAVAMLLCMAPADARSRGEPKSDERKAYCFGQYVSCVDDGIKKCDEKFPDDALKARACYGGVETACSAYFHGEDSPCMTQARVKPFHAPDLAVPPSVSPDGSPPPPPGLKKPEKPPKVLPPR